MKLGPVVSGSAALQLIKRAYGGGPSHAQIVGTSGPNGKAIPPLKGPNISLKSIRAPKLKPRTSI